MSAPQDHVFERRFSNRLEELVRIIEEAVKFLEERNIIATAVNHAHLVMEEMGTNILKYGYDDRASHQILLRVEVQAGAVLVVLEDDGHEFNPLAAPEPDLNLPLEEREPGGLGIHLVRKLASQVEYERRGPRNRLAIRIAA